ncbi:MAG: PEP-utilizing enzyme [bacterium]
MALEFKTSFMTPNLQKFLYRKHSTVTDNIIVEAWTDEKRFNKLTGLKGAMKDLEVIDGAYCIDMNWMDSMVKKYKNKPVDFFRNFASHGYIHGEALKKFIKNLNLEKPSRDLKKDFFESVELLKNLLVFHLGTHPLAKALEEKIIKILKAKNIQDEELDGLVLTVTKPEKLNDSAIEEKELGKIKAKSINPKFDLKSALLKHSKKFGYLGYREPFSKGFDLKFFKKRLKDFNLKKNAKDARIKLKFSKEEGEWIELAKEYVYFRNYRGERLYEALYNLENLWEKLALCYNLRGNDIGYYLIEETDKLFKTGHKTNYAIINKRKNGFGFIICDKKISLITGKNLEKKKEAINKLPEKISLIKGIAACKGIVKGIVKIVLRASEQDKVKKNDILATNMTTPDYLPSMKKASAFITDEGGITCHAAIVARELGKPCIIGTKIATQVLKDGDLVEVDANNGVVKILK